MTALALIAVALLQMCPADAPRSVSPVGWVGGGPGAEDAWVLWDGSLFTGTDGAATAELAFAGPERVAAVVARIALKTGDAVPSFQVLEYQTADGWKPLEVTGTLVTDLPAAVAGTMGAKDKLIKTIRLTVKPVQGRGLRIGKASGACALMEIELYGEPPKWDAAGKGTVIFDPYLGVSACSGTIKPAMRLEDRPESKVQPYVKEEGQTLRIGNGFLELVLERGERLVVKEILNKVTGESRKPRGAGSEPLEIVTGFDGKDGKLALRPIGAVRQKTVSDADEYSVPISGERFHVEVDLEGKPLSATAVFEISRAWNYVRAWLVLKNVSSEKVFVDAQHRSDAFTYIEWNFRDKTQSTIWPGVEIDPGKTWRTESVVALIWEPAGRKMDLSIQKPTRVRETLTSLWLREYMRTVCPDRLHWVEYNPNNYAPTMDEAKKLARCGMKWFIVVNCDLDKKVCGCLGMAKPEDRAKIKKLAADVRAAGLPITAWDSALRNLKYAGLDTKASCACSPDVVELRNREVALVKEFGLAGWGLDFGYGDLACKEKGHLHPYHPKGRYSKYWAFKQSQDYIRRLRAVSQTGGIEGHIGWGNQFLFDLDLCHIYNDFGLPFLGEWWDLQNAFNARYWAENMVLFTRRARHYGVPCYRKYKHWTWGSHFTSKGYEVGPSRFSLLTILSSSANLVFAGLAFKGIQEDEVAFTRAWVDWAGANRPKLATAEDGFPQPGSLYYRLSKKAAASTSYMTNEVPLECVAHIQKDRGWFFLVNPTYRPYSAKLTLEVADQMLVRQLYPEGKDLGEFKRGEALELAVPPKRVLVFKVGPEDFVCSDLEQEKKLLPPTSDVGEYLSSWKSTVQGNEVVFETQVALDERAVKRGAYLHILWDVAAGAEPAAALPKVSANGVDFKVSRPLPWISHFSPNNHGPVLAEVGAGKLRAGVNTLRVAAPDTASVFQGAWLDLGPIGPKK